MIESQHPIIIGFMNIHIFMNYFDPLSVIIFHFRWTSYYPNQNHSLQIFHPQYFLNKGNNYKYLQL